MEFLEDHVKDYLGSLTFELRKINTNIDNDSLFVDDLLKYEYLLVYTTNVIVNINNQIIIPKITIDVTDNSIYYAIIRNMYNNIFKIKQFDSCIFASKNHVITIGGTNEDV